MANQHKAKTAKPESVERFAKEADRYEELKRWSNILKEAHG